MASRASVWLSNSRCIYENLAVEHWLLTNWDQSCPNALLIWRNRPAVVIGRHQNPWIEADIGFARAAGIDVARRHSGGGTVYHDEGNVNFSYLTSKQKHHRLTNLLAVCKCVASATGITLSVNSKHDILLENKYKVSGTAAKITSKCAYHHFTLMLNVDLRRLKRVLRPSVFGVETNATSSVISSVKTLNDVSNSLDDHKILREVVDDYRNSFEKCDVRIVPAVTERQFPGIENIIAELRSWQWIFGATPRFHVQRTIRSGQTSTQRDLRISIYHGIIEGIIIKEPSGEQIKVTKFTDRRFDVELLQTIITYCLKI